MQILVPFQGWLDRIGLDGWKDCVMCVYAVCSVVCSRIWSEMDLVTT